MKKFIQDTQTSYDRVAVEYAERFKDERDDKPFDRDCLYRLARAVGSIVINHLLPLAFSLCVYQTQPASKSK